MPQNCRDCKYWVPIPPWQGNCKLRPTQKPQWSQSATPADKGCTSFAPKWIPDPHRPGSLCRATD